MTDDYRDWVLHKSLAILQFFNQKSKFPSVAGSGRDRAIHIGVNLTSNLVSVFCLSPQSFRSPLAPAASGWDKSILASPGGGGCETQLQARFLRGFRRLLIPMGNSVCLGISCAVKTRSASSLLRNDINIHRSRAKICVY